MNRRADVRRIAALLSDPGRSEHPRAFPADSIAAANAGLYSWWADAEAQELFLRAGGIPVGQFLYVGQAGATRWPSGRKSTVTLKRRIRSNHLCGNLSSSTFRRTISALLRQPLILPRVHHLPGRRHRHSEPHTRNGRTHLHPSHTLPHRGEALAHLILPGRRVAGLLFRLLDA